MARRPKHTGWVGAVALSLLAVAPAAGQAPPLERTFVFSSAAGAGSLGGPALRGGIALGTPAGLFTLRGSVVTDGPLVESKVVSGGCRRCQLRYAGETV